MNYDPYLVQIRYYNDIWSGLPCQSSCQIMILHWSCFVISSLSSILSIQNLQNDDMISFYVLLGRLRVEMHSIKKYNCVASLYFFSKKIDKENTPYLFSRNLPEKILSHCYYYSSNSGYKYSQICSLIFKHNICFRVSL